MPSRRPRKAYRIAAVHNKSISGVINPLVAFYDIHGKKGEVSFFCSVPGTTED
jgi:hypothetical protein